MITRDNAVIITNAIAFIKVTDPIKAVYGIVDFAEAIRNLVQTTLRSITGEMDLDQALSSRDKIKVRLKESISDEAIDWGLTVKSVEIQDIKPSESMVKSMELQAAAERERKAVVTRAEGAKQAMILEAEGRLESAKRDAVAQVTLAESSAQAIQKVAHAVGDQDTPMLYLLGEKYIHALDKMAASQNARSCVLPADLQEAVRGLFTKKVRRRAVSGLTQQALLLAIPFPVLRRLALVVLLLALGEPDLELDPPLAVVQVERNERVAGALHAADQPVDLLAVHAAACGCASDPARRGLTRPAARSYGEPIRYSSASLHDHVGFLDLGAAGAYRLHLPALEREAGLEALLDEVVVEGFPVLDDAHRLAAAILPAARAVPRSSDA